MRVIFMGTSAFSVPVLEALHKSEHELIGIVTQPDRPAGRRHRLQPSPVKVRATELGMDVLQPERASAKSFVAQLQDLSPDVLCVVAYGQILRKRVLDLPPCGCLNVHPSLLPRYRGAAPIQRAIINGEPTTGVTIMLLDEGEDTGDIVLQREVTIEPEDTSVTLAERLAMLSGDLMVEAMSLAPDAVPPHIPQDHSQATHAPKLSKDEARIDWHQPAETIHNQIRGMQPWPGTVTDLPDGNPVKVLSSHTGVFPGSPSAIPGTIHVTPERDLWVQANSGGLRLDVVQPANKRAMQVADFVNGYRIESGMVLGTRDEHEASGGPTDG